MLTKTVKGVAYPVDAFAYVADRSDPSTWHGCMWRNGGLTLAAVRKAAEVVEAIEKREFTGAQREKMAGKGQAMPGGGFPIANEKDLKNAIQAIGRAKNPDAAKAHIKMCAKKLGLSDLIPNTWKSASTNPEASDNAMSSKEKASRRKILQEAKQRIAAALQAAGQTGQQPPAKKAPPAPGDPAATDPTQTQDAGKKKAKMKTVRKIDVIEKQVPDIDTAKLRKLCGLPDTAPLHFTIDEMMNAVSCGPYTLPFAAVQKMDDTKDPDDDGDDDDDEGDEDLDVLKDDSGPGMYISQTGDLGTFDEDDTTITYTRRLFAHFKGEDLEAVDVTDGVVALIGQQREDGPLTVQSVSFQKSAFPTVDACRAYLEKHQAALKAMPAWSQEAPDWLPVSGQTLPFSLHGSASDVAYKDVGQPLTVLKATHPVRYDLRFGSDALKGFFGFTFLDDPSNVFKDDGEMRVALLRTPGPAFWLNVAKDGDGIEKVKGNYPPTSTYAKHVMLNDGAWHLEYATPTCLVCTYKSADGEGALLFRSSELGWLVQKIEDAPPLGSIAEWTRSRFDWVVAPEGQKHALVPVREATDLLPIGRFNVLKSSPAQRYTLGVAYPANEIDVHKDWASADQLERTAWQYLTKARSVGLYHKEGTSGAGIPVESYIYRGPDWTITDISGNEQVVKAGTWLLGVVWDRNAWSDIEERKVNGYSIQGLSRRVPGSPAQRAAA